MLNLKTVAAGQRLRLRNGAVGEVVENLGDGIWVQMRFITAASDSPAVGEEELVHCEEIAGFADKEYR